MLDGIQVTERPSPELRCSYCHDTAGALEQCHLCGTSFHASCRMGLAGCPTLGCRGLPPRSARSLAARGYLVSGRETAAGPPARFRDALLMSLVTGVAAGAAVVFAEMAHGESGYLPGCARAAAIVLPVVHYVYAPGRWAMLRRGDRSPAEAAVIAFVSMVIVLAVALVLGVVAAEAARFLLVPVAGVLVLAPAFGAWAGAGTNLNARSR